ncbi:interleukin-6 receptor subunit beta-like [Haliotis asinina]|uniref:interleukin-6 receptor subunit beta-like n=1 Tax=Haliotis asinina TaxID=109174 RepID=UPI003532268B
MTRVPGSWDILSAVVLVVLLSHSLAFLVSKGGKVRPSNPYGFINETLTLNCTVTSSSYPGNVSGSLFFVKDFDGVEKVLPMQYITPLDNRSIQLDYPITSGIDQGTYVCKLNKTDGKSDIIDSQYTSIEYRPRKVEKTDCHVFDWRNMTCTWDLGVDYVNMNRLTVRLEWAILNGLFNCSHQSPNACIWKEHDGEDSFKTETYMMRVRVTVYNNDKFETVMDEAVSNFTMVDTLTIVEPAPVQSLTVGNKTSTCLSLMWNHKQHLWGMMYTVHVHQRQGSVLKLNTTERELTVCDLDPARTYTLQVSCIPLRFGSNETTGFYSDWTSIVDETLEDVPSGVPGMQNGSFVYRDCNQSQMCTVTIYWKPIPLEESNGEITQYTIKQEDTQLGTSNVSKVPGSATSYDLKVMGDREYSITLTGETRVGVSAESKPVVIPLFHNVPLPLDIVVEADSSSLYVTWGVPQGSHDTHKGSITSYTLFYCNRSKITSKCGDAIHWLSFTPEVLSYVLEVPDGNFYNKLIGMSVEKEIASQRVSSGIKWNSCMYDRNKIPPRPQSLSFSRHQPDNALSVEWQRFGCEEDLPYITHYVLSYCPKGQHRNCEGQSVQVNMSNTEESHVIQGLSTGVTYGVTLQAVSRTGEGPETDPIFKLVENSDLTPGAIAGISFGGIFAFIVVISFMICCIKRVRQTYRNMPLDIKLPEFVQVDEYTHIYDKENNNMMKETAESNKTNNTDNIRIVGNLEGRLNSTSHLKSEDNAGKTENDLETVQQDLKHMTIPCSGESTDSECEKTKMSHTDSTDPSTIQVDSYLKLALSGNSTSTKQDTGSDYVTRDKLSLLVGKSSRDASCDKTSHSSGQNDASSPPPPYEPPRSPGDQKLETPPPTYSSYVSSQTDFPSALEEKQIFPCSVGDNSSHPLSVLQGQQPPSSFPCGDAFYDESKSQEESTSFQEHVTPKPQSHSTDSPYIPFDKIQPPQPPQPPKEQKTVLPPADGYVSVSEASQMINKHGLEEPKAICQTVESGNYCKIGINGNLGQLANSGYISQADILGKTSPSSNSCTVPDQATATL